MSWHSELVCGLFGAFLSSALLTLSPGVAFVSNGDVWRYSIAGRGLDDLLVGDTGPFPRLLDTAMVNQMVKRPPMAFSRLALSTCQETIIPNIGQKIPHSNSQLSSVYVPAITNDASR